MSVEINLYDPTQIDLGDWGDLQHLQREAFKATLDRPDDDIDVLVDWGDFNRYYYSHIDPNTEVGRRFRPDQSYSRPRLAVATNGDELVGFGYTADNVSWSLRNKLHLPESLLGLDLTFIDRKEEQHKLEGTSNRYLWMREIAVNPDYQRQGVGKDLGHVLLKAADELQPVAAYTWPYELTFITGVLRKLGFEPTSNLQRVDVFGEGEPALQVRMQASSVGSVLEKLDKAA